MEKKKYYKYLFLVGAVWNWIVAISLLLLSVLMLDLVSSLFGMAVPPSLIWFHVIVALIFVFGIGYYIVGRDLSKNHGLVLIGLLEKFLFFFIILVYFFLGDINILIIFLTGVDFLFGCLFVEFLMNYNKE